MSQPITEFRQIVVADHDSRVRGQIEATLIAAGYEVRTAGDGQQALELITQRCPDLIIADADMSGLSGVELARRLRQDECPHYVYLLLLTAHLGAENLSEALSAGVDHFLPKPVSTAELLAQVFAGGRVLEARRQLDQALHRDSMTGLLSRRAFQDLFDRNWNRAQRHRAELSCALVEIDHLDSIAEEHGTRTSDETLRAVAELLRRHARASDLLCHVGGGRFLVLLPDTSEEGAAAWCRRVAEAVGGASLEIGGKPLPVSLRVGVAGRVPHLDNSEALVEFAQQALEASRSEQGKHVVRYRDLDDAEIETSQSSAEEFDSLDGVCARDVMTAPVACLEQDQTVVDGAGFLISHRCNAAPVVDDAGRLVGIISERELLDWLPTPSGGRQPLLAVMNTTVVSYDEHAPALAILRFLQRVAVRRVVVLREGRPVGIISRGNFVRWFHRRPGTMPSYVAAGLRGSAAAAAAR